MTRTVISMELITHLPDKRAALRACALYSGKQLKAIAYEVGINDPGHLSKMLNVHADPRHFPPEKENLFMDVCGNEIPLLWSLMSRGYSPPSALQELHAKNMQLQAEVDRLQAECARLRMEQGSMVNIFKNIEVR
jgi:hypothetical protein